MAKGKTEDQFPAGEAIEEVEVKTKSEGRELKPGCAVHGLGKPYIGGTKRCVVPESLIKKHKLKDKIFK